MTSVDHASDPFLTEDAYAPSSPQGNWCGACQNWNCWFRKISPHIAPPGSGAEAVGFVPFCDCPPCCAARFKSRTGRSRELGLARWEASVAHDLKLEQIAKRREQEEIHKHNAQEAKQQLGPREFTLTYGDQYASPEEAKRAMNTAIERLTRYYKDEIIEFHAVGEYTKAGRPHIHGWYHLDCGRKITDKNFKRAYPPWNPKKKLGRGFEGGHHATIERVSDFHGYTEKHLEEAWHLTNITNDHSAPSSPQRILEGIHEQEEEGHPRREVARTPDTEGDHDDRSTHSE